MRSYDIASRASKKLFYEMSYLWFPSSSGCWRNAQVKTTMADSLVLLLLLALVSFGGTSTTTTTVSSRLFFSSTSLSSSSPPSTPNTATATATTIIDDDNSVSPTSSPSASSTTIEAPISDDDVSTVIMTSTTPSVATTTTRPPTAHRIPTRLEEKLESLSCEIPQLPTESRLWRGNQTHELLLPITVSHFLLNEANLFHQNMKEVAKGRLNFRKDTRPGTLYLAVQCATRIRG